MHRIPESKSTAPTLAAVLCAMLGFSLFMVTLDERQSLARLCIEFVLTLPLLFALGLRCLRSKV